MENVDEDIKLLLINYIIECNSKKTQNETRLATDALSLSISLTSKRNLVLYRYISDFSFYLLLTWCFTYDGMPYINFSPKFNNFQIH